MDNKKFYKWLELSNKLKLIKKEEMSIRKELCQEIFKSAVPPCKEKRIEGDYEIVFDQGVTYSLEPEVYNAMHNELSDIEKQAIKITPSLKLRQYKALPKESLLHEAVTTKPTAPTIKVTQI